MYYYITCPSADLYNTLFTDLGDVLEFIAKAEGIFSVQAFGAPLE